jgi:hypothetical protein
MSKFKFSHTWIVYLFLPTIFIFFLTRNNYLGVSADKASLREKLIDIIDHIQLDIKLFIFET